jgi:hypothetical protein
MLGSRVRSLSYTVAGRPAAAPKQRAGRRAPRGLRSLRHSTRVDSTPLHSAKCPFDWSGLSLHCMQSLQSAHWSGLSQHHRPRLSPPAPSPDECTICAAVARHCPFSEQLPQPAQTTPSSPLRSSIQTSRASSHTHKRINQASARASTTGKRVIRRSSART